MKLGLIDSSVEETTVSNTLVVTDLMTGTLKKRTLRSDCMLKFVFTGRFDNGTGGDKSHKFKLEITDGTVTQTLGDIRHEVPNGADGSYGPRYRLEYDIIAAAEDMSSADNAFLEGFLLVGDKNGGGDTDARHCVYSLGSSAYDVDWTKEITWTLTSQMYTADADFGVITSSYHIVLL